MLPPVLLRFCLSVQAGYKVHLRRKGLPQEIVSSLKAAQHQFIYFSLPSSTAHNLYFCALFLLECRSMTSWRSVALFFSRVVIGRMNCQNCEAISVSLYFYLCSRTLKNKTHIPNPKLPKHTLYFHSWSQDEKLVFIFSPRNDYQHLNFRAPHREKFPSIFKHPFSEKWRHLCRPKKETSHFKIQWIKGDTIKVCREAATPVVTVCLTSQVTTEPLFPLHHQKKYCLSFYTHDTIFVTSFLKLLLFAQCI